MNHMNEEEPSRYIDAAQCDYFVDQDRQAVTEHEPRYKQMTGTWDVSHRVETRAVPAYQPAYKLVPAH